MGQRLETISALKNHAQEVSHSQCAADASQTPPLPEQPFLFCGPCQLESQDHALRLGEQIATIGQRYGFHVIFKGSFDKANRTKRGSPRGVGLEASIPIFEAIQRELDLPTITDIHLPSHPEELGSAADVLQIPAFLCRQTDLLVAAGRSGKIVNLKKGQFVHPSDLQYAAEKITAENPETAVFLCERGTCFGYRDLIVDMRGLLQMRQLGYPVVFDGSHVVQSMSGKDGVSGGDSRFTAPLCRAAVSVGVDALFIETHETPRSAPSDADSMLPLCELEPLFASLQELFQVTRKYSSRETTQMRNEVS
jgi:2-dehydro-3-deoxyphosphooctonate aldolase (KDO 8-P synthase)